MRLLVNLDLGCDRNWLDLGKRRNAATLAPPKKVAGVSKISSADMRIAYVRGKELDEPGNRIVARRSEIDREVSGCRMNCGQSVNGS